MEVVNCINGRFFGEARELRKLVDDDTGPSRVKLGSVVGIVTGADVCNSEHGDFIEFAGTFRVTTATRAAESGRLIIPGAGSASLLSAVQSTGEVVKDANRKGDKVKLITRYRLPVGASLEFAVALGVARTETATGYGWTLENLLPPAADNPLNRLAALASPAAPQLT